MMGSARSIVSAVTAIGSRASSQVFLLGLTLVATRCLSPADFGLYALASIFVTLARSLLYSGPFEYLMKAPDLEAPPPRARAATALVALGSSLVRMAMARPGARLFGSPEIAPLMVALAPSTLIASLASWQESLVLRSGKVNGYYAATMAVEAAT